MVKYYKKFICLLEPGNNNKNTGKLVIQRDLYNTVFYFLRIQKNVYEK